MNAYVYTSSKSRDEASNNEHPNVDRTRLQRTPDDVYDRRHNQRLFTAIGI